VTLVGVGISWATTGNLNTSEIHAAIGGAGLALVTLGVPNRRKPA
jgi:acetyl-CoA carboxylase beta subunit